jgi:hypothetical protein
MICLWFFWVGGDDFVVFPTGHLGHCQILVEMSEKIIRGPTLTDFVNEPTLGSFFFNCAEKYKDQICQVRKLLPKSCQILRVKENHIDRWHLG